MRCLAVPLCLLVGPAMGQTDYGILQQLPPVVQTAPTTVEFTRGVVLQDTPGPSPGATPPGPAEPPPLDLEQAIELTIGNDPVYQQINWEIEQTRGDRYQATRWPNPVASVVADDIGIGGFAGQYGLQLSQNIVRNGRPQLENAMFEARLLALQQQYEIRRWQLARQTTIQFLDICRLGQQKQVNQDLLGLLEELSGMIDNLFAAGEVSAIDPANMELEIRRVHQDIVEIDVQIRARLQALSVPLGLDGLQATDQWDVRFDWPAAMDLLLLSPGDDMADAVWLTGHPQVRMASARAEQQRRQIAIACSRRRPDLRLQGSLSFDSASEDPFGAFQVGLPLLKNDNKSGLIRAARAGYQQSLEMLRQLEMQLVRQYSLLQGQLARMQSRVLNIQNRIIPPAEKNLQNIRDAFSIGEADWLLLKSGFDQVQRARLRLVQAQYEMAVARTMLDTLLLDTLSLDDPPGMSLMTSGANW